MRRRTGVQGACVETGFERLETRQATDAAVDQADVVFENGVRVDGVAKVHGDVRQRRLDEWVDVRVSHKRQDMLGGAEDERIKTVVQGDGLGADHATGVEKGAGVLLGRSRRAKTSLRRTAQSQWLWLFKGELVDQVPHLGWQIEESRGFVVGDYRLRHDGRSNGQCIGDCSCYCMFLSSSFCCLKEQKLKTRERCSPSQFSSAGDLTYRMNVVATMSPLEWTICFNELGPD